VFEKVFDLVDSSNDKKISKEKFKETHHILEKMKLGNLNFDDIDKDKSG